MSRTGAVGAWRDGWIWLGGVARGRKTATQHDGEGPGGSPSICPYVNPLPSAGKRLIDGGFQVPVGDASAARAGAQG